MPTAGNLLKLSFGINAPESRAIFTDTKLPDNSPVGVKLDGYADYANLVYTGSTTSGTQSWSSTTSVTLTDTKGTLYAYWPQNNAVSIDAIDVDMTAADQTDWLYATPVADVSEDKAEVAVTMNHALANINVTVNKGSYFGAGNITNITVQSDGIALGGTFNAAQTTPGYTAFEDEGKPLSRTVSTTTGAAATDIMVVPTGTSAAVTFLLTIDDIQFTAKSDAVQLAMGNSYQYTLNLSDISTYMEISGFSVKPWNSTTGGTLDLNPFKDKTAKVYAVSTTGELIDYNSADATATGVALVAGEHKFMIAKADATNGAITAFFWGKNLYGKDVTGVVTNDRVDGTNNGGYLPKPDGTFGGSSSSAHLSGDFTTWTAGTLAEFNGAANTAAIIAGYTEYGVSMRTEDMCTVLNTFNASDSFKDWYVPACGQLALMYLNKTEINKALAKIGGTALAAEYYWSSSEYSSNNAWRVGFNSGYVGYSSNGKNDTYCVRFVRDIEVENKPAAPVIYSAGKANGVYVVTATGQLVDKTTVAADAIGVALITANQRILIEKMGEANTDIIKAAYDADAASNTDYQKFYWGSNGTDVDGVDNFSSSDAVEEDYSGKNNTAAIIATPDTDDKTTYANMGTYCKLFNEMSSIYSDWYIPALGQLYEIYSNKAAINEALTNISGTTFNTYSSGYWSSSEYDSNQGWSLTFGSGGRGYSSKNYFTYVRFVRDIE